MKRSIKFAPLTLALLFAASAHAQGLPNVDKYATAPAALSPAASYAPVARGFASSWDTQRGVPTFFWADPSAPNVAANGLATAGPEALARAYVEEVAGLYQLTPAALAAMELRGVRDTGRGGIIVVFGQRVDGIEVHRMQMKVLLDRSGQLVAIGGNLFGGATPKAKGTKQAFSAGPAAAIAKAVEDAYGVSVSPSDVLDLKTEKADYHYYNLAQTPSVKAKDLAFATPARAKKVFYAMPGHLVPAYYLEVDAGDTTTTTSEMFGYVISAKTGEILLRESLSQDASFKYRVWSDAAAPYTPAAGPQADYCPNPTGLPDGNVPAFVAPILTTMDGFNSAPGGGFDPWLDGAATTTSGNNVFAYADIVTPDGYQAGSDVTASVTAPGEFDRVYDVTKAPNVSSDQRMAAVTQLFYITNWLHDYWYDSGFNEAAGNAQASNLGRGGVEGDVLHAEGQDYGGMNNANMNTPADGASPRMQMYLWNGYSNSSVTVTPGGALQHQDAAFGQLNFDITADVVLASDSTGTDPNDLCSAVTNNIAGKIALVNRGTCTFASKATRAQQAGAIGVIIANNSPSGLPGMGADANFPNVTIPATGIGQADGNAIKAALLQGAVSAHLTRINGVTVDGTIDGDTVAHEWGHYLHHRNTDCGSTQCGGQSEGWADFDAMMMKVHEGDNVSSGTFALSIYATTSFPNNGYFGIRRFPYTRDMSKNGLTFKHITNGVPMPPGPIGSGGATNFEVHNVGEVWCTMLFQGYSSLLISGGHTFVDTKRRMADYVVQGMQLAPANPTFTEQRDGILAAAAAADPSDFLLLAQGFADRGAGTCAVSPARASTDGSGVVEDFTVSSLPALDTLTVDDSVSTCDGDGFLDTQETGLLHLKVRNAGAKILAGTMASVASSIPGISFPKGNSVAVPDIAPFQTANVTVQVAIDNSLNAITDADFTVTLDNAAACNPSVQDTRTIRVNLDDTANASTTETVDTDSSPWTHWGAPTYENLADVVWTRDREMNGNFRFYGQDFPAHSDTALVTPDLVVDANANFVVTFKHAFDFEAAPQAAGQPDTLWDGGLIEYTADGGMTWTDVKTLLDPGYNGVIANVAGADNPLKDRPAYTKQNTSWPATDTVTLDFGNQLANKTVKLRFRIGTDAGGGLPDYQGWYIDDIDVQGVTNKPFHLVTADAPGCNLAPVASAGADLVVNEGTVVQLDASGSSDPDGDTITYAWSQTKGPGVTLSDAAIVNPTFTAPMVDADTPLAFQVEVSDPLHKSTASVNVLVKDVPVMGTGGMAGAGGSSSSSGGMAGAGGGGMAGAGGSSSSSGGMAGAGGGMAGSGGTGGSTGTTTTTTSMGGSTGTTTTTGTNSGTGGGTQPSGGCGCETAGNGTPANASLVFALGGLAAVMMRRRRRARSA
jgi:MYXO-CTERM domain-containing protein